MSSPRSTIQTTRGSSRPAPGFQSYTVASGDGAGSATAIAAGCSAVADDGCREVALEDAGDEAGCAAAEAGAADAGAAARRPTAATDIAGAWRIPPPDEIRTAAAMAAAAAAAAEPIRRRRAGLPIRIRRSVFNRSTPVITAERISRVLPSVYGL